MTNPPVREGRPIASLPPAYRVLLFLFLGGMLALVFLFLAAGKSTESNPPPEPLRSFLSSFKLPEKMVFAGQPVPLGNWQVRERIEYEFYQFLSNEGDNIILAKRTGRCFPPVERMLAEAGMPDDLKYMLLVESKCAPAATSSAKAVGPWQFMSSTGHRFDLKRNYWKDERRDLERSTEAAIQYLKLLHDIFGDWFLVLAAYNAGEQRILTTIRQQNVEDYWKVRLNRETMRYVPRIMAVKEIFSNPGKYLGLSEEDRYAPVPVETITVNIPEKRKHLADLAELYGSYFLELKLLNPDIRKDYLPKGIHQIKVPQQSPRRCSGDCAIEGALP